MWDPQVLLVTGKGMSNMTAESSWTNSAEGVDFPPCPRSRAGQVYSTGWGCGIGSLPTRMFSDRLTDWSLASLDQFSDVDLVAITKELLPEDV